MKNLPSSSNRSGINENDSIISALEIDGFGATLTITFTLERESIVSICLFDANGRLIANLEKKLYSQGPQSVTWNANDLPQGACFVLLESGDCWVSKKIVTAG